MSKRKKNPSSSARNLTTFHEVDSPCFRRVGLGAKPFTPADIQRDDVLNKFPLQEEKPTVYMFGEKNSGFTFRGPPQNYSQLLQNHLQTRTLFEDPSFAPDNIILTNLKGNVEWKRPSEIVRNPQFIVDGATRFDVEQGRLGDCWFLAAIANLTTNQQLLEFVVPPDQDFERHYAGIFHFRFWQYGQWVDVVVDDRLPTINGQLVYLSSSNRNEFWSSLLEKAYAKLYGSYRNIEQGLISDALEDMSGGLSEVFYASHPVLYEIVEMSYNRSSFMGCSITGEQMEGRLSNGLVTRHAYSITKIAVLNLNDRKVRLLRIRNPWGNEVEWNGAWSDGSEMWHLVPPKTRNKLLHKEFDGEFWMEFDDFQKKFTYIDICHLRPCALFYGNNQKRRWHFQAFEGAWVAHVTAGGGLRYNETFPCNPQYFLRIKDYGVKKRYAVVVGLMQKYRRELTRDNLILQLAVYAVSTISGQFLDKQFFETNRPLVHIPECSSRQLTARFLLPPGDYCIIPSTEKPNEVGQYLLRVFSEIDNDLRENDNEVEYNPVDCGVIEKAGHVLNTTFEKTFRNICGSDQEVGWDKIWTILNKIYIQSDNRTITAKIWKLMCVRKPKKVFSEEVCRSIVALWDQNYTGRLDCHEFWRMMSDIVILRSFFKEFDKDNSGTLSGFELRSLLAACGYKVNTEILNIIMLRYGRNGNMTFDDFVLCAFKIKAIINEHHDEKTEDGRPELNLTKNERLKIILYK